MALADSSDSNLVERMKGICEVAPSFSKQEA